MKKYIYLILTCFLMISCKPNNSEQLDVADNNASEIIEKVLSVYNTEAFFNTKIDFNIKDLNYSLLRQNNISNFEVIRETDSTTYKATYSNGFTTYQINNEIQEETSISRQFIEVRLEGIVYLFSIPHVFNQNAVKFNKLKNVLIREKDYYAIHVSFTKIEGEPENEFILYVNPETYLIDYFADKFNLNTGDRLTFKVAHNFRTLNDIVFADYFVLTPRMQKRATDPKPNTPLEDIYKSYNELDLDELTPLIFENLKVEPN